MRMKRKFERDIELHETFLESVPTSMVLTIYWMTGDLVENVFT